ncbi:MAG: deoxyribonuclease V [Planctomycetaceae bacterium]|nr:deoxyribonuclease V [Planctomycetaceae bacterium]
MKSKIACNWNVMPAEARAIQTELMGLVSLAPMPKPPRLTCGLDCSISADKKRIYAAAVVFTFPELELVEEAGAVLPVTFPYVPGLLSFREIPVCMEAVGKLKRKPDLYLIDGQGFAHPRRVGIASHIGLCLGRPTVGCAKSRLIGTYEEPGPVKGDYSRLYDKDEQIGAVVRTRDGIKPLFISPGHLCSFEDAIRLTLAHTTLYRVPEPTRIAHQKVGILKHHELTRKNTKI